MTFLEKAMEINKKLGRTTDETTIMNIHCPQDYMLEDKCRFPQGEGCCAACWNREMPITIKTENVGMENITLQEAMKTWNEESYNQGLNDAWKVFAHVQSGEFSEEQIKKIWGIGEFEFVNIFTEIFH